MSNPKPEFFDIDLQMQLLSLSSTPEIPFSSMPSLSPKNFQQEEEEDQSNEEEEILGRLWNCHENDCDEKAFLFSKMRELAEKESCSSFFEMQYANHLLVDVDPPDPFRAAVFFFRSASKGCEESASYLERVLNELPPHILEKLPARNIMLPKTPAKLKILAFVKGWQTLCQKYKE